MNPLNTPESIATALWNERDRYPNLADDDFLTQDALLTQVKHELRAIHSFSDLTGAQAWFKSLNDSLNN